MAVEQEEPGIYIAMCYTCEFKPNTTWLVAVTDILTVDEWLEEHREHRTRVDWIYKGWCTIQNICSLDKSLANWKKTKENWIKEILDSEEGTQ